MTAPAETRVLAMGLPLCVMTGLGMPGARSPVKPAAAMGSGRLPIPSNPFFPRRRKAHEAIQYGETMTDAKRPSSFRHFGTEECRERTVGRDRLVEPSPTPTQIRPMQICKMLRQACDIATLSKSQQAGCLNSPASPSCFVRNRIENDRTLRASHLHGKNGSNGVVAAKLYARYQEGRLAIRSRPVR
jgi:hypothetical protein